jgi:co-chaperonin GroES (HSP10)
MTSEVKTRTQWVQEAMIELKASEMAPIFEQKAEWGAVPFRSFPIEGHRWRHFLKPGVNETGLHPLGHAVLIAPDETQLSNIILMPEDQREKELMNMTIGRIVEIGPSAWMDEPVPRAFPGEMVVISKFAGAIVVGKDEKPYRMVNSDDVYCRRDEDWPERKVLEAPREARREKKGEEDE